MHTSTACSGKLQIVFGISSRQKILRVFKKTIRVIKLGGHKTPIQNFIFFDEGPLQLSNWLMLYCGYADLCVFVSHQIHSYCVTFHVTDHPKMVLY